MPAHADGGPLTVKIAPSIVHLLYIAALEAPDRPALTFAGETISYAQYAGLVAGLAKHLRDEGAAGGRVAVVLANSLDAAVALFAAQAAGAQVVPLNPFYTPRELQQIFADAEPCIALFHRGAAPAIETFAPTCKLIDMADALDPAWSERGAAALANFLPRADELAMLQYTGGTT